MSGASVKLVMNHAGRLLTRSKPRFNDDQKQLIDRAYAGTFGAVYNPGSTKTIARALRHQADSYRAHLRSLDDRRVDLWTKMPPEFDRNRHRVNDKNILKKIQKLLKANNTYQTPKK